MNVLAINGSPHSDKGHTARILTPFLEGMSQAGAHVEVIHTRTLNVKPCSAEFHCWLRKPGTCFQDDDMPSVLDKIRAADVLTLATPLHVEGMAGPLKNLLDRTIPLMIPFIHLRDGHCRHPMHDQRRLKVVLVASCGFWELDNFDALVGHVKAICRNLDATFVGALLRPHTLEMALQLKQGLPLEDVLEAARQAGRELVQMGEMRQETLAVVSRDLAPREQFLENANRYFRRQLDEAGARIGPALT